MIHNPLSPPAQRQLNYLYYQLQHHQYVLVIHKSRHIYVISYKFRIAKYPGIVSDGAIRGAGTGGGGGGC